MYLVIILLPLISSFICGFLGRLLGSKGSNFLLCFCMSICCILCCLIFYEIGFSGSCCHLDFGCWISSGLFNVSWGFLFDSITVTMLITITFISLIVHIYSTQYMKTDPHCIRFMCYLSVFTFFMILLVSAKNMVQMFLGWEGVGLASYLLINFWYTRLFANQSAIKALVVNRIGDFGLILSILLIFYTFHSLEYSVIFSCVPFFLNKNIFLFNQTFDCLTLIGLFLCIGAFGKSAQLGLHSWLPDAMEGPTPVSALIHAATMVTAGVFLVIRFSPLLEYTPFVLFLLVIIGSLTTFFASITGIFQHDIKKIIAYSTCSQLGYMIFICGISYYHVSIFHLVNHSFFKALLFLSAGSVIHVLSDEQDIRRMGAMREFLPLTYSLILIGSLSLIGFPFLTGFYSKDLILELTKASCYFNLHKTYSIFSYWLGAISVLFTSLYSFRLLYVVFLNSTNLPRVQFYQVYDCNILMGISLISLTFGSIFVGYLAKDLFIGLGTNFWRGSIFILPKYNTFFEIELLTTKFKWLPFIFTFLGFSISSCLNIFSEKIYNRFFKTKKLVWYFLFFISKKWYFDQFYNKIFVSFLLLRGYHDTFKNLDKGFLDLFGPLGLSYFFKTISQRWILLQTGQITHYVLFILIGLLISFFIQSFSFLSFLSFNDYLIFLNFVYLGIFYNNKVF